MPIKTIDKRDGKRFAVFSDGSKRQLTKSGKLRKKRKDAKR